MAINATKSESLRAKYDLDIEQLDYKFILKCKKVKTIENILKVLRSGQEGVYPDLIRFTEERLRTLKPNSSLLRTEQPATTLGALDSEIRDELLSDLKQWKHEVSAVDDELNSAKTDSPDAQLPPVRGTVQLSTAAAKEPSQAPQEKPARILSHDYAAWDRYDVTAQLKLLDESGAPAAPEPLPERSDPAIDDQPPVKGLSAAERSALALRERQKGNEYFRSGDFSRAAVYYTRSINASPTAAAFNNRAQTNLKLGKYGSALLDCGAVLCREPRNVKALLRRGIARQMNRDWIKARADFQQVLQIEPNNPQAMQHLDEVDKSIIGSETKRSKVLIQEVDSIEEENVTTPAATSGARDDQRDANRSGRAISQRDVSVSEGSDVQNKAERAEGENAKKHHILPPKNSKDDPKKQPILIEGIVESNNNTEEVVINARCKNRKTQKENTSHNAASERSKEEVIVQEHQRPSSSYSKSSDTKTSSNDPKSVMVTTTETRGQDAPIGSSQPSPSESVEDGDVRHRHPATPSPDGWTARNAAATGNGTAAAPRRWRTFEFLHEWRSVHRSGRGLSAYAALLRSVSPHQLTGVLGSELDSAILSTIIRCVQEVMLAEDGPERCQVLLEQLTDARRFHVVKLLLDNRDRQRLRTIAKRLQWRGADISLLTRCFLS